MACNMDTACNALASSRPIYVVKRGVCFDIGEHMDRLRYTLWIRQRMWLYMTPLAVFEDRLSEFSSAPRFTRERYRFQLSNAIVAHIHASHMQAIKQRSTISFAFSNKNARFIVPGGVRFVWIFCRSTRS